MLSEASYSNLNNKGLELVSVTANMFQIVKNNDRGNTVLNKKYGPIVQMNLDGEVNREIYSDCPIVTLRQNCGLFEIKSISWSTGNGPGDFEILFNNEEVVVTFLESYFFGENSFFNDPLQFELKV